MSGRRAAAIRESPRAVARTPANDGRLRSIALWFQRGETFRGSDNMRNGRLAGAALAALLATSTAGGATVPPEAGKYLARLTVTQATGTQCPVHRGDRFHGVVQYPGFTAKRLTIRAPIDIGGYPAIDTLVLTVTSGAGSVRLRGRFLEQIVGGPIDLKVTGSFAAVLTLTDDPKSFTVRLSEDAASIDCNAVVQIALVQVGP
jgi:hypothetical protein